MFLLGCPGGPARAARDRGLRRPPVGPNLGRAGPARAGAVREMEDDPMATSKPISEEVMVRAEAAMEVQRAKGHATAARYDASSGRLIVSIHNGVALRSRRG